MTILQKYKEEYELGIINMFIYLTVALMTHAIHKMLCNHSIATGIGTNLLAYNSGLYTSCGCSGRSGSRD